MNYSSLVPSRELCEEMARLGICQDGAELFWSYQHDHSRAEKYVVCSMFYSDLNCRIIAPTLARMMEELPDGFVVCKNKYRSWNVATKDFLYGCDGCLSNAVAKALVHIKRTNMTTYGIKIKDRGPYDTDTEVKD